MPLNILPPSSALQSIVIADSLATWEENSLFQSFSPASQDVEEALRRRQRSTTVEEKEVQLRRAAQELLEGERSKGGGARREVGEVQERIP